MCPFTHWWALGLPLQLKGGVWKPLQSLYTRSVQKVSSHMIWKIEIFIEEDTRDKKHCTKDNNASVPFKVGTLGPHTVLPIAISCPVVFSWIYSCFDISSLSEVILVWGKARSHRAQNLACRGGLNHLGDLMFYKKLITRHEAWVGPLSGWSCQSPAAHSCSPLNHPSSFRRGMFKLNVKYDADLLLYLLIHFEFDSHTVHMLTQLHLLPPMTSTTKSSLFTHAHASPLLLAARLQRCGSNCSLY